MPQNSPRNHVVSIVRFTSLAVFAVLAPLAASAQQPASMLLDTMTSDPHRGFISLGKSAGMSNENQLPPYFLSYSVSDPSAVTIRAQYGAIVGSSSNHVRVADVQVRLGEPRLDNTHGGHRGSAVNSLELPLVDDREALARSLWVATNTGYGNAVDNYLRVKTEAQVRAKEEDTSPDFSNEPPQVAVAKPAPPVAIDRAAWEQRVRALSKIFREYPDVYQNLVLLTVQ